MEILRAAYILLYDITLLPKHIIALARNRLRVQTMGASVNRRYLFKGIAEQANTY